MTHLRPLPQAKAFSVPCGPVILPKLPSLTSRPTGPRQPPCALYSSLRYDKPTARTLLILQQSHLRPGPRLVSPVLCVTCHLSCVTCHPASPKPGPRASALPPMLQRQHLAKAGWLTMGMFLHLDSCFYRQAPCRLTAQPWIPAQRPAQTCAGRHLL